MRTATALLAVVCAVWSFPVHAANLGQQTSADGLDIHYSVVSAEELRGYPAHSAERLMHGGVPRASGQRHLMIAVFDSKTRKRIGNASISARVAELAQAGREKALEPMPVAGEVTYGNYFAMSASGPYRVTVMIRRPGIAHVTQASFDYTVWKK